MERLNINCLDLIRGTFVDELLILVIEESNREDPALSKEKGAIKISEDEMILQLTPYERTLYKMYLEHEFLKLQDQKMTVAASLSSEEKLSLSLSINKNGKRLEIIKFLLKEKLESKLLSFYFYEGTIVRIENGFLIFDIPKGNLQKEFDLEQRKGGSIHLESPETYLIVGIIPKKYPE